MLSVTRCDPSPVGVRRRAVAVLVTLGCTLAVVGCGSSELDACELLTDDAAAEVLGVAVYDGELDTDRTIPATYCRWVAEGSDRSEGADATYEVWVAEGSDRDSVRRHEDYRAAPSAEPIDGLGPDAFFVVDGGRSTLYLKVGERAVAIGVTGDDRNPVSDREARERELRAGEHVVARLS
jgi:hypothetical protein